jgi:predicted Zn-dependent peptidase
MNQHFAPSSDLDLKITRLPNGLTVATEAMPHVATATLGVWVGAGSRHEREAEHGLSHLIEHMAFKGTARRSARQIAEDIENVGGDINAATSVEYTSYTARVLGENVDVALDVLGDILIHSAFDAGELAREKGVILQEYAAVEDTPDDLIYDAFMETAFGGQPLGRPILGTPKTVKSFDEATIRAFMEREYAPGKMVLAAAGDVDHGAIVAAASAASAPCRRWPPGSPSPAATWAASGACGASSNRPTWSSACRAFRSRTRPITPRISSRRSSAAG